MKSAKTKASTATRAAKTYKGRTFEQWLLASAESARAIARGEMAPAREAVVERTARNTAVTPPPSYDARRISRVRRQLGVSQPVFARLLNVSPATVRGWERGARVPEGASLRLLEIAEQYPRAVVRRFVGAKARVLRSQRKRA